jgi:hypothetical protein
MRLMCINVEAFLVDESFALLEPLFEQFGKQEVLDAIHNYYHNHHRSN